MGAPSSDLPVVFFLLLTCGETLSPFLGCEESYTPGGDSAQCGIRKASQAVEIIKNEHGENMSRTAHGTLRTTV